MSTIVFFLEEASAKAMLEGLLPNLLPDTIQTRFIVFEGKQDLEKQLERKLRGWLAPNSAFIVLRDQDSGDCIKIKQTLVTKCQKANKPDAIVRIACRELESWYFGDLEAVEQGLGIERLANHRGSKKYRIPDKIVSPSQELEKITKGRYQKVIGSRSIGPKLSLEANSSRSFKIFIEGVRKAESICS